MNNIRLLLLGGALVIANATPAVAGGGGELIKAAQVAVQSRTPVLLQASTISLNATKGLTSILSTSGASTARFLNIQPPTPRADIGPVNPLKTGMAAQVVASEDRNLSSVSRLGENSQSSPNTQNINLRLSVTEVLDIVREVNPAELDELPYTTQQYLFLTGYPITVVEGPVVLTEWQINKAKSFYTYLFENYAPHATNADNLAKVAAAITDLGLIGDLSDARQIVETVTKMDAGLFTGVLDVTAVRALINLGAYNEIKQLVNFRLSRVDGNGRPMMLPSQWGDLQAYLSEVGVELNIPAERLSAEPIGLNALGNIGDRVAFYNPYNIAHDNSSVEVTRLWVDMRRGVEQKAAAANVQVNVAIPSLPAKPATPITQPTTDGPVPPIIATHFDIPPQELPSQAAPVANPAVEAGNPNTVVPATETAPALSAEQQLERKRELAKLYYKAKLSGSKRYILQSMREALLSDDPFADVSVTDEFVDAFRERDFAAMDFWLEFGANINEEMDFRNSFIGGEPPQRTTALQAAVKNQDLATVKYLVDKGADVSTLNWLPLEFSYRLLEIEDIVIYIIDHGGANAVDEQGVSLFDRIHVIDYTTVPLLQHLYDNGVDIITKRFPKWVLEEEGIVFR